jgi:hypothetical protein
MSIQNKWYDVKQILRLNNKKIMIKRNGEKLELKLGNNKLIFESKNELSMLRGFFKGSHYRRDHYGPSNVPYKFAAYYYFEDSCTKSEVLQLCDIFLMSDVIPSKFFLYDNCSRGRIWTELEDDAILHNCYLHIYWNTKCNFKLPNRLEYLKLSLQFAKYIDSFSMDNLVVDVGSFLDDPDPILHNKIFLRHPGFNKRCFGLANKKELFEQSEFYYN